MVYFSEELKFSAQHKRTLRKLTGQEIPPDTILHDLTALLDFVKARKLTLTGKHQLPLQSLPEINAVWPILSSWGCSGRSRNRTRPSTGCICYCEPRDW